MGVIVRPDDLSSIMAEVYARLEAIERTSGPMHDFAIRDANGILRVAGGNLPALGISPAQEGMRVCDQYGNPIFDTLGLSQVMQVIGSCAPAPPVGGLGGASAIAEYGPSGHASFSVSRPVPVLVMCSISFSIPPGGGMGALSFGFGLDQTAAFDTAGTTGYMLSTTVQGIVPVTLFMAKQVAAGSHAMSLLASNFTGVTVTSSTGVMNVFQEGA